MRIVYSLLSILLLQIPQLSVAQQLQGDPSSFVLREIGTDDDEDSPYFFGLMMGMALDGEGNLYLVDRFNKKVKVFNWMGEYQRSIGRGAGNGPGEFNQPFGIYVDSAGRVYVSDRGAGRITIFSADGDYYGQLSGILTFGAPTAIDPSNIFVSRGAISSTRPQLLKYSLTDGLVGDAIPATEYSRGVGIAGWSGVCHSLLPNKDIVAIRSYPYEIIVIRSDLSEVYCTDGKRGIVDTPPREIGPGRWRLDGVAFSVAVGLDGLVYVGLRRQDGEERRYFLDVYSPNGDFLTRIALADIGVSWLRFFAVGENHVIVCDVTEPFPRILWIDLTPFIEGGQKD